MLGQVLGEQDVFGCDASGRFVEQLNLEQRQVVVDSNKKGLRVNIVGRQNRQAGCQIGQLSKSKLVKGGAVGNLDANAHVEELLGCRAICNLSVDHGQQQRILGCARGNFSIHSSQRCSQRNRQIGICTLACSGLLVDSFLESGILCIGQGKLRCKAVVFKVLDPSKDGAYCAATQDDDRNKCPKSSETPPAPIDFVPGFVGGRRQHSSAGRKSFFFSRVNVEGPCISFCWSLGMIQEA